MRAVAAAPDGAMRAPGAVDDDGNELDAAAADAALCDR